MLRERWETTWGKWLGGHRPVEAGEEKISVGDRFYCRSKADYVWIVDRVYTPAGQSMPHARTHRMDDEMDSRLRSQVSLLDRKDFAPDRRKRQDGEPASFARRRLDKPCGHVRSRLEVIAAD